MRNELVAEEPLVRQGREPFWQGQVPLILVIALGGGLGAAGRYGVSLLWPTTPGDFPWATLLVNFVGCALMGILLMVIAEARSGHRLVQPFVGTGVLGGFTTFSAYALDLQHLVQADHLVRAIGYLVITVAAALLAVWLAGAGTKKLILVARRGDR